MWEELRDKATGHMIGRIDPSRLLLEVKRKSFVYLIDLSPYLQGQGDKVAQETCQEPQK